MNGPHRIAAWFFRPAAGGWSIAVAVLLSGAVFAAAYLSYHGDSAIAPHWHVGSFAVVVLLVAGLLQFFSSQRSDEARYRALFEANPLPMMIRDEGSLAILAVNQAMVERYGYSHAQFAQMKASDLNSAATRDEYLRYVAARSPGKGPDSAYRVHITREGTEIEVEVTSRPLQLQGKSVRLAAINDLTEKLRGQRALHDSEQRFRTMFDYAGIGIAMRATSDRASPWLAVNDKFCEMTGHSRDELLRMSGVDSTPLSGQAAAMADSRRLQMGEVSSYAREKQIVRKDGSLLWVNVSAALLPAAEGQPRQVIVTYQDIHARKLAEERLRESEERLRAIIAAEPECMVTVALDGRLLEINPVGLRMLGGGTLDAVQRRPLIRYVLPRYRRAFVALHQQLQAGYSGMLEFEVQGLANQCRWLEVHAAPLRDATGNITALLGIARDVTERRMAREMLATERNLLRTVIDNLPDSVRVRDCNLRLLLANAAWFQLRAPDLGPEGDLSNQQVPPGRHAAEDHAVVMTGRASSPREDREETPAGPRWYVTTKLPLRGSAGDVVGTVSIGRDVTDAKRRAQEVEKLQADLELRVVERTAQLSVVNEELDAFAASISHDLRAPLRSIDGLAALLAEGHGRMLDTEGQYLLSRIRTAATRMAQQIEDLLRLSRVAREALVVQAVDVSDMAHAIIRELRREHPERVVVVSINPELRAVADPGLLRSALENLLQNAWKFTSKIAAARIEIGSVPWRGSMAFFVSDNGAGFDRAGAERLFGTFQRLHTEREFPGTGIGLAIVRRVMRRHGGDAWAESTVGCGATFFFTLTGAVQAPPAASEERAPVPSPVPPAIMANPGARRAAILLVDDDPDLLLLTAHALRPDGYEVLTAETGEAAMEILGARAVSAIVSDFSMPGMNGVELLAQAAQRHPTALRILVSGQRPNGAMQAGLRNGEIHHYFEKQSSYEPLRACLRDGLAAQARLHH